MSTASSSAASPVTSSSNHTDNIQLRTSERTPLIRKPYTTNYLDQNYSGNANRNARGLQGASRSASSSTNDISKLKQRNQSLNGRNNADGTPIKQSTFSRYYDQFSHLVTDSKYAVGIHCFMLLFTALGNSVYFKKMIDHMPNHVYFLNQFTSVLYVPIFGAVVLYQLWFTDAITPEMRAFPKMKFLYMGIFDGISSLFMMFGAVHTSGSVQALLANAVIPVTMWMSYTYLSTKYNRHQVIGAAIIMAGIGVVLSPQVLGSFFSSEDDLRRGHHGGGDSGGEENTSNVPFFNLLFVISVIPLAISSIYREVAFEDNDIDINYMQSWTSFFQMLISVAMVPFNTMSFLGNQQLSWSQLITALPEGWTCLTGTNVITRPYCQYGITEIPMHGLPPCDSCPGSWLPMLLYMTFNILFNVFTVTVIKYGGATLMFVVMTLRLPITQFAFSIPAINDPPDKIDWATITGLICILVGLVFYKYQSEEEDADEQQIIPPILGFTQAMSLLRHERAVRLNRDEKQIRNQLYTTLGIIPSPPTPRTHRTRGSIGGSPLQSSSRSPGYMRVQSMNRNSRSQSMDDLRLDQTSPSNVKGTSDREMRRSSGLRNAVETRSLAGHHHSSSQYLEPPTADADIVVDVEATTNGNGGYR